jgi:hypothetical protein
MAYITEVDLKTYLGIGEEGDDVLLEACIDRAKATIDTYTHRTFDVSSDTTRYFGRDAVDGLFLYLDHDLYSLTSIANGDSSGTAVDTDDITEWPQNDGPPYHALRLDSGSSSVWQVDTDYWIAVTGQWGYSATPPNDIVQAAVRLAGYYYRQADTFVDDVAIAGEGVVTLPEGMPVSVRILLDPYVRRS